MQYSKFPKLKSTLENTIATIPLSAVGLPPQFILYIKRMNYIISIYLLQIMASKGVPILRKSIRRPVKTIILLLLKERKKKETNCNKLFIYNK